MKKLMSIVLSLSVAGLMTACGGGDDGPAPTGATVGSNAQLVSFAGTYMGCFAGGTTSEKETLVFTQQTADTFSVASSSNKYAAAGCAGAVTGTSNETGTASFTGTKTIGAETVNKFTFTKAGSTPSKQVALIKGSNPVTLTFGKGANDGGAVDSEGYPTTFENSSFTKQ